MTRISPIAVVTVALLLATTGFASVAGAGYAAPSEAGPPSAAAATSASALVNNTTDSDAASLTNETTDATNNTTTTDSTNTTSRNPVKPASANLKISSALVRNPGRYSVSQPETAASTDAQSGTVIRVVVEAAPGKERVVMALVGQAGGSVETSHDRLVQAQIPESALTGLARSSAVEYVRQPIHPEVSEVTSQGLSNMNADDLHASNYTGENVTVAVIDSTGFDLSNPEIADQVVGHKNFSSEPFGNGTDGLHGTAVAELVADTAPNASLLVYKPGTYVEFMNAIDHVDQNTSADVVAVSMSWYGIGPLDGTSSMNRNIDDLTDNGTLWVNSAGNSAKEHWNGTWSDPDKNRWMNFSGSDELLHLNLSAGEEASVWMQWNDWTNSHNDYNVYAYESPTDFYSNPASYVDYSVDLQNGTQDPDEVFYNASVNGDIYLAIRNASANGSAEFTMWFRGNSDPEYRTRHQSVTNPGTGERILTVGAAYYDNNQVESFSSNGPTIDGRQKPDIVAPDGVSTSAYSGAFYGTSAAAPHAAGTAALVLDASNESLTPSQLKSELVSNARDVNGTEPDYAYGHGMVDAQATVDGLDPYNVTGCVKITSSGRYELRENFTNGARGACIDVESSDVTIDGNGHTIDGGAASLSAFRIGVEVFGSFQQPYSNVTVRNLTTTNSYYGVVYDNVTASGVENVTATDGGIGFYTYNATNTTFRNVSTVNETYGFWTYRYTDGVTIADGTFTGSDHTGVYVSEAANVTLDGVTATNSGDDGVSVKSSTGTTIRNLTAKRNGDVGLYAFSSSDDLVVRSATVKSNNNTGVQVDGSVNATVADSRVVNNSFGIAFTGTSGRVHSNVVHRNQDGIAAWNVTGLDVSGNNVSSNDNHGIYLDGVTNATVVGNDASDLGHHGIELRDGTRKSTVRNNTASGNAEAGILLYEAHSNVIRNNDAVSNIGSGIRLTNSTTNTIALNNVSANANGTYLDNATGVTVTNTTAADNSKWAFYATNGSTTGAVTNYALTGGASVDFAAHDAALRANATPPATPSGKARLGPFVNATNTSDDGWLVLNVTYDDADVPADVNESSIRLHHFDGAWTQVPGQNSVDTAANDVSANVTRSGTITALGQREPIVDVTPGGLAYGNVSAAGTATASFDVSNEGNVTLDVTGISVTGPDADAFAVTSGGSGTTVASGSNYTVTVEFAPTAIGDQTAVVSVAHNDSDASPSNVSVSGTGLAPSATLSPDPVAFGDVNTEDTALREVNVTNDGNVPLNVTGATVESDATGAFSVVSGTTGVVAPGENLALTVEFAPSAPGSASAVLNVTHNASGSPTAAVLEGTGVEPVANVTPAATFAGRFNVTGAADTINVTVRNDGGAPLNVTSMTLAGDDVSQYAIASGKSTPVVVGPGQSHEVTVAFDPTSPGNKTVVLSVAHNDTDASPSNVSIGREAVDATAPVLANATAANPADGSLLVDRTGSVEVTVNVTDNVAGHVRNVTVDASAFGAGTVDLSNLTGNATYRESFAVDASNAIDGDHQLPVTATDESGNSNTTTTNVVTLDTTNASLSIEAPANGTDTNSTTFWINGTANDTTSGVAYVEVDDSGVWRNATVDGDSWSYQFTAPSEGTYDVDVRATDEAGNVGPTKNVTVTVDTSAPSFTLPPALGRTEGILPEAGLRLAVNVSDGLSGVNGVTAGDVTLETTTSPNAWNTTADVQANPALGDHTLTVTVRDAAGNANATRLNYTVGVRANMTNESGTFVAHPNDTNLRNVTIVAPTVTGNQSVTVGTSESNPTTAADPSDVGLAFPQVNTTIPNADIENGTLNVTVPRSRVTSQYALDDTVSFWVRDGSSWESTNGTLTLANDTHLTYEVETPHFSAYALAAKTETTRPTISGLSPGDGATVSSSSVAVTANYDDGYSGVNASAVTLKVDGTDVTGSANTTVGNTGVAYDAAFDDGSHAVELVVADEAGNVRTRTWTFTVDTSTDGGGSGGGGGGGSVNPTVSAALASKTATGASVDVINGQPSETARTLLPGGVSAGGVTYTGLAVSFAEPAGDFALALEPHADRPSDTDALSGATPVAYYTVESGASDATVASARVSFTLPASALPSGANPAHVAVFRYHDGAWQQLDTTRRGEKYTATSPGFSAFAVAVTQPDVVVTDVALDADSVSLGEQAAATITVENRGTREGTRTVEIRAGGEVVASTDVTVAPGESTAVALSWTPESAGTYDVTAAGQSAGSLSVAQDGDATSTSPGGSSDSPGGSSGDVSFTAILGLLTVLAVLVGALYARHAGLMGGDAGDDTADE